jgi:hypothetical protein
MIQSPDADTPLAKLERYDAFVSSTRTWLARRACRYHWYYNASRIALVVISILIPTVSSTGLFGGDGQQREHAVSFLALLVALLAALDGLLKPGDNWRHFRSYQLALDRCARLSRARRSALELESDAEKKREKLWSLYLEFVQEIEGLLEEESRQFFEHQIQQLRLPGAAG